MGRFFTGDGRRLQEIIPLPLDEEGLRDVERKIKLNPHFLGEPLVVVAEAADFPQLCAPGTHLLVALDALARTTVVTLGLGAVDAGCEQTAVRVAAALAQTRIDDLGRIARSFIGRPANDALRRLWEELDVEITDEAVELTSLVAAAFLRDAEEFTEAINATQRLIIAAEGFTSQAMAVLRWLHRGGLNVTALHFAKLLLGGQEIFSADQVVPTPDSAVDAPVRSAPMPAEPPEPWRVRGKDYYSERLAPRLATLLDELLVLAKPSLFSLQWTNKHYFWIRGSRRNFRMRAYQWNRLELGFHNAAPAAVTEFLDPYGLGGQEVVSVGGYADSPFVALTPETRFDEAWSSMINDWLSGAPPGRSAPGSS